MKEKLKQELKIWLYYFIVSFLSSLAAYNAFEYAQRPGGDEPYNEDINLRGIIAVMWYGYYRWWFYVFIGLSMVRFLVICLSGYYAHRKDRHGDRELVESK